MKFITLLATMLKTTLLLASLLFLSACLESDDPLFSVQDGVTTLKGGHGFHVANGAYADDPLFIVGSANGAYNLERPGKEDVQAIAVPLPGHENFYTVQRHTETGEYNYLLVYYTKGSGGDDDRFFLITFEEKEILAEYKIDGVNMDEYGEDATVHNRRGLEALFSLVLQTGKYDDLAYDMYDLDDKAGYERYKQVIAKTLN